MRKIFTTPKDDQVSNCDDRSSLYSNAASAYIFNMSDPGSRGSNGSPLEGSFFAKLMGSFKFLTFVEEKYFLVTFDA